MDAAMKERAAAVAYLRAVAKGGPPAEMLARYPEWTPAAMLLAVAANLIERGEHLAAWQEEE
jgi:hypothetical protein